MYKGTMEKNEAAPIPSSLWNSLEQLERRLNRIEAALRGRMRSARKCDESFAFGRGTVDRKRFGYVNWRNEFVRLSPRELMLLEMFAERPNEVLARDMLLSRLWGSAISARNSAPTACASSPFPESAMPTRPNAPRFRTRESREANIRLCGG